MQPVVMECIPIARGTGQAQSNKNTQPGLSTAQTHCQLFHKEMHLPQNNFPQMDNPRKGSGSFPQDLNCSWKGEFPTADRKRGLLSLQGSSSRAGPNSQHRLTKATPGMVNIHPWNSASSPAAAQQALAEDMEEMLHTHLTQQSTANSHHKLLNNYSPVPL